MWLLALKLAGRDQNSARNFKTMVSFYKQCKKFTRKGPASALEARQREMISKRLESIEKADDFLSLLTKLCPAKRGPGSSLAREAAFKRQRSLQPETGPSALAMDAPEASPRHQQEPETLTRSVSYKNTLGQLLRTRKQACNDSAQKCSRRLLLNLLPGCVHLDICNAGFVIMQQLVAKLSPCQEVPKVVTDTLESLANHREQVCSEKLRLGLSEGKQLLIEAFNGARLDPKWTTNDFLKDVQRTSYNCRWLACSGLPDVHQHCRRDSSKKQPDVSTMFFMLTAAEDYIMQSWVERLPVATLRWPSG